MDMPGRKYPNSTIAYYRYGFNGKEKETDPIQYDYGFRIYDPRLMRFKSVDPISKDYAGLTPYQFASNRPIDGIDMDGLEYLTYTIILEDMTGSGGTTRVKNSYYVWNNSTQHNVHGPLGKGVLYDIKFYDRKQNRYIGGFKSFVGRNASVIGIPTEYGNYMGATALYKVGTDGQFTKTYDYKLPAVDQVDNLALSHDLGYDKLGAVGQDALFNDWGTTPVDIEALNGWQTFLTDYYINHGKDALNGQSVTSEERNAANNASILFSKIASGKQKNISKFIRKNFSSEASKDVQSNYNLFLNKYMHKDADGNWKRNEGMWNGKKNEDGTTSYTPLAPKKS